jgi:hypothetical protein
MLNKSRNSKYIHICISYSESFSELCNLCCSSMYHDKIILHVNKFSENIAYAGFKSEAWDRAVKDKIVFLQKIMSSLENNACIGLVDADTQTFNTNKIFGLKQVFDDQNKGIEYIGMYENIDEKSDIVNTGFYLLKNNKINKEMINNVASANLKDYYYGDQDLINKIIKSKNIKTLIMPSKEFTVAPHHGFVEKDRLVFHHATCTYNLQQKKEQLNKVRQEMGLLPHNWSKNVARHKHMIMYENGVRI